jgi:hypothetical protein
MLFLKTTALPRAPGIYEVDIAAKPPGKTFGVYLATDPNRPPAALLGALAELGFVSSYQKRYTHRDGGQVLDLHFMKEGTDMFQGWTSAECSANLAALDALFGSVGLSVATRVMSMAEAYA